MKTVKVMKLHPEAKLPTRKYETDAGLDFYVLFDTIIKPQDAKIVQTGITIEIPKGYMLLLKPKSRNDYLVGGGVVDTGYEPGEILVKIINPYTRPIAIKKGDAIAQGVFVKIAVPEIEEVSAMKTKTERAGKGGIVEQVTKTQVVDISDVENF